MVRMTTNEDTINRFYTAFQERDYAAMADCYHPSVHFSDPVFPDLRGKRANAMWHMLCDPSSDLVITFNSVSADGTTGSAHWEATYSFGKGGRIVHNNIDAEFTFEDGKIIRHVDSFDLWAWSRMALGPIGTFIGWMSSTKSKIRETAGGRLSRFVEDHPEYINEG